MIINPDPYSQQWQITLVRRQDGAVAMSLADPLGQGGDHVIRLETGYGYRADTEVLKSLGKSGQRLQQGAWRGLAVGLVVAEYLMTPSGAATVKHAAGVTR